MEQIEDFSRLEQMFEVYRNRILDSDQRELELAYLGVFNQIMVHELADEVERIVQRNESDKVLIKKIFSVFVEGLNNIRCHGYHLPDKAPFGFVILSKSVRDYRVAVSNPINPDYISEVKEYLIFLNTEKMSVLKTKYEELITEEVSRFTSGAGFGLLMARIKTDNIFAFEIDESGPVPILTLQFAINRNLL